MHDAMKKRDRLQSRKEDLYVFGGEGWRLDDDGENHIYRIGDAEIHPGGFNPMIRKNPEIG